MEGFWSRWTTLTHAMIAAAEGGEVETFAALVERRGEMDPRHAGSGPEARTLALEDRLQDAAMRARDAIGREVAGLGARRRAGAGYR